MGKGTLAYIFTPALLRGGCYDFQMTCDAEASQLAACQGHTFGAEPERTLLAISFHLAPRPLPDQN